MKDGKETSITFRTSNEVKKKLETMAAKENRSVSNLINLLLEKVIKDKK